MPKTILCWRRYLNNIIDIMFIRKVAENWKSAKQQMIHYTVNNIYIAIVILVKNHKIKTDEFSVKF